MNRHTIRHLITRCALAVVFVIVALEAPASGQCLRYSVDIIEPPPCGFNAGIGMSAISEAGEMCGGWGCAGGPSGGPIAWFGGPPLVNLQQYMPSNWTGDTTAINSTRQIVGRMHNTLPGDQRDHAFLYQDGTISNLGGLVAYTQSYANGINDSGTICGESIGPFGYSAVVWSNGQIAPLGLPVGPNSGAYDLSENGLICGYMGQGGTGASHAFVYDLTTGNAIDVGTPLPNTTNASATGVNSFGTVCGQSWIPCSPSCGVWRGFLWSDGVGFDLGVLPSMTRCNPNDVNDSNVVVGSSSPQTGNAKGFVWQSGVMYALNDVVPPELNLRILSASSINSAGQIAAHGFIVGGPNVALRLNPIPPQPGDATCDWFVNAADILTVIAAWGDCPLKFTAPCPTDLNDDHRTGVPDLLHVINHWGQGNGQP